MIAFVFINDMNLFFETLFQSVSFKIQTYLCIFLKNEKLNGLICNKFQMQGVEIVFFLFRLLKYISISQFCKNEKVYYILTDSEID